MTCQIYTQYLDYMYKDRTPNLKQRIDELECEQIDMTSEINYLLTKDRDQVAKISKLLLNSCLESLRTDLNTYKLKNKMLKDRIKADQRKFRILEKLFAPSNEPVVVRKQIPDELKQFNKDEKEIAYNLLKEATHRPLIKPTPIK